MIRCFLFLNNNQLFMCGPGHVGLKKGREIKSERPVVGPLAAPAMTELVADTRDDLSRSLAEFVKLEELTGLARSQILVALGLSPEAKKTQIARKLEEKGIPVPEVFRDQRGNRRNRRK